MSNLVVTVDYVGYRNTAGEMQYKYRGEVVPVEDIDKNTADHFIGAGMVEWQLGPQESLSASGSDSE